MPNELFGEGPGRREGVVAKELDDSGEVTQPRLRGVDFPVVDGRFIHLDLLSHLGLEQAEIEPTLSEVVAYRNELARIGLERWLGRFQSQMATRQRNGVPTGGSRTPIGGAGAAQHRSNATSRGFPDPCLTALISMWTYPQYHSTH